MNKFKYFLRGLETLFYFLLIVLCIIFVAIFQLIAAVLGFPLFFHDKYFLHKLGNRLLYYFINIIAFNLNPHWRCEILSDLPERDPKKRRIFMFNHIWLTDPFVTTFLGRRIFLTSIYKDSIHKGYPRVLMELVGHLPIYFKYDKEKGTKVVKKECIPEVMRRCKVLMDHGFDLLVYPEGTRTKTGKLQELRDGFFRFSKDHDFEIVPCVVHNTKTLLTKELIVNDQTCYLMTSKPISPKGKTVEELKLEVRKEMYKLIKQSPAFNPSTEKVEELE